MAEEETAYRYTIPLTEEDGVEKPAYTPNYEGDVLVNRYDADNLVVVQTESTPHFHKESVNVQVEEVDTDEYTVEE